MEVINPIYDTSFKYLMEDEKSAKILLSALLRQKVLRLEPRPQETATPLGRGGDITIYRLDYSAHVLTAEGREEDVCVEIQKVWLQTELSRFRKYLASQYADEKNVQSDGRTPRHIVAIYLLGHMITETDAPVVYCHGGVLTDYDGAPVAMAGGGSFVRSLTHDVIIVQIPRLPERPRNATERVLSIFNQRRALDGDRHLIEVPDGDDEGAEVDILRRRLSSGACTSDMRRKMQLEDEFLIEVQSREEEIEVQKMRIAEQGKQIEERNKQIQRQDERLQRRNKQIQKQGEQLQKQGKMLGEKDRQIEEQRQAIEAADSARRSAIIALAKAGTPVGVIAASFGVEADYVERVVKEN